MLFCFEAKKVLALNAKFDNWQEFSDVFDCYCHETYQTFVKGDSKTVDSVNKHQKEPFTVDLKYAFVHFTCVHYG